MHGSYGAHSVERMGGAWKGRSGPWDGAFRGVVGGKVRPASSGAEFAEMLWCSFPVGFVTVVRTCCLRPQSVQV